MPKNNEIDYSILPEHMQKDTELYIERGIMTGSFMTAVMCNDLVHSFAAADDINTCHMQDWANFLYNEAPMDCWGSKKKVVSWKRKGGLNGNTGNP